VKDERKDKEEKNHKNDDDNNNKKKKFDHNHGKNDQAKMSTNLHFERGRKKIKQEKVRERQKKIKIHL